MNEERPVLEGRDLTKSFFGNTVLKDVDIELRPGRIHALLGENGAGKSTLINLLSGALTPDSGQVAIDGGVVQQLTPSSAREAGIAVVQQELSLTGELSIGENIGLGAYPKRFGLIDYGELEERAREVCERVGVEESLDTPVDRLPLGRQQMVEIAKALFRNPRVMIFDEPTSSLSAHEVGILSRLIQRLCDEGVALLYISHRLNEVEALCTHVTVLRDGIVTADQSLDDVDSEGLVRLMVGRDPGNLFPPHTRLPSGEKRIEVHGFRAGAVHDVDFTGRAGEIIGVGGLVGQGQEDFLLGLYGALPAFAREAQLCGRHGVFPSVGAANAAGVVYVPADRKKEGLVLSHSIASNLLLPSLGRLTKRGMRERGAEQRLVEDLTQRLKIIGDTARAVRALSGGNQQKVAVAKWLPLAPAVLLLNDPTRGVDIETKREIYRMLREFADEGKLVVLLSSDTPELVHLCDRVLVFAEGRVVATLERDELSEEKIVGAAMGVEQDAAA